MSDFMLWLHANYIKPQLDKADITGYETISVPSWTPSLRRITVPISTL